MRGHADVREFLEHIWRAFPDMRFGVLEGPYLVTGEPKAAWWWRGEGTMTGPLDPPGFAPTRKRFQVDGVDFHEYRDGKLARLRIAFNLAEASQQLGLLPAAGGRGEQLLATVQRLSRRVRRA